MVYPITVEIDPTNLCNHRCQWCVSMEAHTGEKLGLERFTSLVAELKDSRRAVGRAQRGRRADDPPAVHRDARRRCARPAIAVGLITNGSMPRPGSVEKCCEVCDWARVSLDAATAATHQAIHGTKDFAQIMKNVADLTAQRQRRTMVGLNFVAEPRNFHEMADFAAMGQSLGVAYVTIRCVFDPDNPLPDSHAQRACEPTRSRPSRLEDARVPRVSRATSPTAI